MAHFTDAGDCYVYYLPLRTPGTICSRQRFYDSDAANSLRETHTHSAQTSPTGPSLGAATVQAPLPLLAPSSPGPRHLQAEDGKCSSELAGQGGHAPCLPLLETRHHMAHGGSRLPSAIAQPGERCPASHPGLEAERPPRIGAQSARPPGHFTPRQNQGVTS